jgi:hypothetical protein
VLSVPFLFGVALIAIVVCGFVAAMTVVAAGLYNVLASQHHGVELRIGDRVVAPDPATATAAEPTPGMVGAAAAVARPTFVERARARVDVLGAWLTQSRPPIEPRSH